MAAILDRTDKPTGEEMRLASESSRALDELVARKSKLILQTIDTNEFRQQISLPAPALRMLSEILREIAKGNSLTLSSVQAHLTTQEAADILNVSRPFLIGLLDAGRIPFQRLGSHRRILLSDLMEFKSKADAAAEMAFNQLTQEAQKLGLGY
ncbi:MAG: helix-turn-helix domain-containing protein [Chthonomonadales bacterium]